MFFKQHSSEGVLLPLWLNNGSGYGRYVTSTVPELFPCRLAACLIRILFHKFCPFHVCFVLLISGAKLSSECAKTRHTGLFWVINNLNAMKSVFVHDREETLASKQSEKSPVRRRSHSSAKLNLNAVPIPTCTPPGMRYGGSAPPLLRGNPLREIRPRGAWLVSPFFVSLNPSGALWTRNMPAKPD